MRHSPYHSIRIQRPLAMHLLQLAQSASEPGIGGIISMDNGQLKRCYPIKNIAAQPSNTFLLEPTEQATAVEIMTKHKEEVYAVYHMRAHPSPPAATDIKCTGFSTAYYLTLSLEIKGVLEILAYQLSNGHVHRVELQF